MNLVQHIFPCADGNITDIVTKRLSQGDLLRGVAQPKQTEIINTVVTIVESILARYKTCYISIPLLVVMAFFLYGSACWFDFLNTTRQAHAARKKNVQSPLPQSPSPTRYRSFEKTTTTIETDLPFTQQVKTSSSPRSRYSPRKLASFPIEDGEPQFEQPSPPLQRDLDIRINLKPIVHKEFALPVELDREFEAPLSDIVRSPFDTRSPNFVSSPVNLIQRPKERVSSIPTPVYRTKKWVSSLSNPIQRPKERIPAPWRSWSRYEACDRLHADLSHVENMTCDSGSVAGKRNYKPIP